MVVEEVEKVRGREKEKEVVEEEEGGGGGSGSVDERGLSLESLEIAMRSMNVEQLKTSIEVHIHKYIKTDMHACIHAPCVAIHQ